MRIIKNDNLEAMSDDSDDDAAFSDKGVVYMQGFMKKRAQGSRHFTCILFYSNLVTTTLYSNYN